MSLCVTCKWWAEGDRGYGYCRAAPPIFRSSGDIMGAWPMTAEHSWCGQHKLKPKEKTDGDPQSLP